MALQAANHILELKDVNFRYPDGTLGLDRCSLQIRRGSRTTVLGANGAGKTTLFLQMNGILRPHSGTVSYGGATLDYSRQDLHNLRSRVGLVFQNPDNQLFSATVREDVSFGPLNLGLDVETIRIRVEEALLSVGMVECADKPVHNLSYGQKKRACIAGVLAMRPEVLILDEPMAGLDIAMQSDLIQILNRLHTDGMTIIIATHDIDFTYGWADEVAVLQSGTLLAHGAPTKILLLEEVRKELGAAPLVAEISRALALTGIGVYDNDCMPRTGAGLVQALLSQSRQENDR
ncbi:MAG: ATP-binding cassette domain-containing protein [Desulfuromonadaceae bacterium]|nr:ATP-binding cassette domain-containing protein [Desulfuromonadaceae bacterium]